LERLLGWRIVEVRKLMEIKVSHANGIEKIDASGLPAGTYIIVLTIRESSSAFKLIKE